MRLCKDYVLNLTKMVENAKKLYLNEKYIRVVKKGSQDLDSKSVVDRPTKKPIDEVLHELNNLNENNQMEIAEFIKNNLHEPGIEISKANLVDWKQKPAIVDEVDSAGLKEFLVALNEIWKDLYKKVDHDDIDKNGCVSSHLPMKHPFIVPGGRFLEMYYWDTYWTIEGLLVCGMHKTVKMMLENFVSFIHDYGFIPNGSRVYYLNRSQPPYFCHMVYTFYEFCLNSKDLLDEEKDEYLDFILNDALPSMIREYEFWMKERSMKIYKNGIFYKLNIFKANTTLPRPESFYEDLEHAHDCKSEEEKAELYRNKASAAESGYDFSSRWNDDPMSMKTIQTSKIVPVDLNSVIYKNELIIRKLSLAKGDFVNSRKFKRLSMQRRTAINLLLWSREKGCWADYDAKNKRLNDKNFYISNLTPLVMGIKPAKIGIKDILNKYSYVFDNYEGGVPVSLIESKEQWDFPNTWAPNQHELVHMLIKSDNRQLALKVGKKFFNSVYQGWKNTGQIFEKYNLLKAGERGHGGEYEVQTGFGWTNGTILTIIKLFKDELLL